ncbi:MAG: O-antigen ligase family protein [Aggregatilineales bacterium]
MTSIRNASPTVRSSVLLGVVIGGGTVIFGALTAVGGPVAGLGALAGLGVALYVLTDLMGGLYVTLAIVALLPFATLPIKVAVTPTFIDLGLASFALVYLGQWMTGARSRPRFMRAHALILAFLGFVIFSFVAGLGHGLLTTSVLRQFVELCADVAVALILADVIRDAKTLRRVILAILVVGAAQAVVGIVLVLINAVTAERLLNSLSRFGYPSGGVIRYVEENPNLAERAIGTWVDPNAYGGFLVIVGALGLSQVLAARPVTGARWLALILLVPVGVALLLTQSRGAWLGLAAAGFLMAVARRRWILPVGAVAVVLFFALPFTQDYAARLLAGLSNQDLATQMRFGEYKDALILIGRYPVIGVGFAGVPDRDIYLGVSSLYLTIAEETGLIGLVLFAVCLLEALRYGLQRWRNLRGDPMLFDVWFGLTAALCGALVSGIFDHFYFDLTFAGAGLMFWLTVGLMLAAARLSDDPTKLESVPLLVA